MPKPYISHCILKLYDTYLSPEMEQDEPSSDPPTRFASEHHLAGNWCLSAAKGEDILLAEGVNEVKNGWCKRSAIALAGECGMKMSGKKVIPTTLEIIALLVLATGVYWSALTLLADPISIMGDLPFSGPFLIIILTFNVIWFATIRFWPVKNIHLKVVLSLLVFAFSAAIATCYIGSYVL